MKKIIPILILPLLLLTSCFGVDFEIALNADGSGIITLEYRVSRAFDAIGRLDGNARWNTIPVGLSDFERSLERLPNIRLLSFAAAEDARDKIITARMEFLSIEGLLEFLDATGQRTSLSANGNENSLILTLNEGFSVSSPELALLLASVSSGYSVRLGMRFPGEGNMEVSDNQGRLIQEAGEIERDGSRIFASFPLYQVLNAGEGMNVQFRW